MNLSLSDEQIAFAENCRELLEANCSVEVVKAAATPNGDGHIEELWSLMAGAGWLGIPFSQEVGGGGGTLFELGLAYREIGRFIVPTTFHSTIHAALVLSEIATPAQQAERLPELCSGQMIGTVAYREIGIHDSLEMTSTRAVQSVAGWTLSGKKYLVANYQRADLVLVLANEVDIEGNVLGPRLFVVERDNTGASSVQYLSLGQDALFEVEFVDCELGRDALLGDGRSCIPALKAALERVAVLQCMEMLGGAEAVLEKTVNYAGERKQFGVPIGTFQAVQHFLADVAMRLKVGELAAFRALSLASKCVPSTHETAVASVWLADTYKMATLISHQIWGGMGYALDSGLYLWTQRAKVLESNLRTRQGHLANISLSGAAEFRG